MNLSSADHRFVRSVRMRDAHPKLILTSPPYPGVHVVYHRWQILGRRETPAPYWIAHLRDGHGEAYYTMGGRSAKGIGNYFESISRVFTTIKQVVSRDTQVVQLVAFSDANAQLPLYLDAMAKAGFEETYSDLLGGGQVRSVPNRKWYNQQRQATDASRETSACPSASDRAQLTDYPAPIRSSCDRPPSDSIIGSSTGAMIAVVLSTLSSGDTSLSSSASLSPA